MSIIPSGISQTSPTRVAPPGAGLANVLDYFKHIGKHIGQSETMLLVWQPKISPWKIRSMFKRIIGVYRAA